MKTEQRFKFINSARPESYVHESRTEHKSLYVVVFFFHLVPGIHVFYVCIWTIFVFMFHIRCIYVDIYAHTCWLPSSSPSHSHFLVYFTYSKQALLFCRFLAVIAAAVVVDHSFDSFILVRFRKKKIQTTLIFTCHYV